MVRNAIEEGDSMRYSLILTDCSMPVMDGYQGSRMIRALLERHRLEELAEDDRPLESIEALINEEEEKEQDDSWQIPSSTRRLKN